MQRHQVTVHMLPNQAAFDQDRPTILSHQGGLEILPGFFRQHPGADTAPVG